MSVSPTQLDYGLQEGRDWAVSQRLLDAWQVADYFCAEWSLEAAVLAGGTCAEPGDRQAASTAKKTVALRVFCLFILRLRKNEGGTGRTVCLVPGALSQGCENSKVLVACLSRSPTPARGPSSLSQRWRQAWPPRLAGQPRASGFTSLHRGCIGEDSGRDGAGGQPRGQASSRGYACPHSGGGRARAARGGSRGPPPVTPRALLCNRERRGGLRASGRLGAWVLRRPQRGSSTSRQGRASGRDEPGRGRRPRPRLRSCDSLGGPARRPVLPPQPRPLHEDPPPVRPCPLRPALAASPAPGGQRSPAGRLSVPRPGKPCRRDGLGVGEGGGALPPHEPAGAGAELPARGDGGLGARPVLHPEPQRHRRAAQAVHLRRRLLHGPLHGADLQRDRLPAGGGERAGRPPARTGWAGLGPP